MEKIKAIKNTEKLCWKCLKEKDMIHLIELENLGYGSIFDSCSAKIQLCEECYNDKGPDFWSKELTYNTEEDEKYGWWHYKHENEISEYFQALPIESQQFIFNEYYEGAYFMEPQDWIDYELGILPHEKAKEYGLYSTQEIEAYKERFPKCKHPVNRIFSDGSAGCWCPFDASGGYNQVASVNISDECYQCPYYEERKENDKIKDISEKDYGKYKVLAKAELFKKENHKKEKIEILLHFNFQIDKLPIELIEAAEKDNGTLKLHGSDVIQKLREISFSIDNIENFSRSQLVNLYKKSKIIFDRQSGVYSYISDGDNLVRGMKIVIVDTSKDWTIVSCNGAESIAYIDSVDPLIGYNQLAIIEGE